MIRQSLNRKNSKIWIYALLIAFIVGIVIVVSQDVKVSSKHISQNIEVTLDK